LMLFGQLLPHMVGDPDGHDAPLPWQNNCIYKRDTAPEPRLMTLEARRNGLEGQLCRHFKDLA
jgi:hypothetical protein